MDADVLVFDGDPLDTTSKLLYCLSKGEVVVE
jgi:imidazolonepropionase-like amidohydrolase